MESTLKRALKRAIDKRGGLCLMIMAFSFTGIPDGLILLPGARIFFIETKGVEKTPRPRQLIVQAQLRRLGFSVWNLWTNEHLNLFLETIDKNL